MGKLSKFKFKGLVMEITLLVVNVLLVLALVLVWQNVSEKREADKSKDFEYNYVRVGEESQGTK